jgi:hypothetical protein
MKRTREEIDKDLAVALEAEHTAAIQVQAYTRELDNLNLAEAQARGITVSWSAFTDGAGKSKKAWKKVAIYDSFLQYDTCINENTCWYRGNPDRMGGLELRVIKTLDDPDREWFVCDMCYNDRGEFLSDYDDYMHRERRLKKGQRVMVTIDPQDWEPDVLQQIRDWMKEEDEDDVETQA